MKITHTDDYRELRRTEYPDIGDQLDVLWKLLSNEAQKDPEAKAMLDKVNAVKTKYKKVPNG